MAEEKQGMTRREMLGILGKCVGGAFGGAVIMTQKGCGFVAHGVARRGSRNDRIAARIGGGGFGAAEREYVRNQRRKQRHGGGNQGPKYSPAFLIINPRTKSTMGYQGQIRDHLEFLRYTYDGVFTIKQLDANHNVVEEFQLKL